MPATLHRARLLLLFLLALANGSVAANSAWGQHDHRWAATTLDDVDEDYAYQGEYVGELDSASESSALLGLQVVALGNGGFQALAYHGGLPGAGWDESEQEPFSGKRESELLRLSMAEEGGAYFEVDGDEARYYSAEGELLGTLEKAYRESPTLGAEPPAGAVLLSGDDAAELWEHYRENEEGYIREGAESKRMIGDCRVHVEYQMPYMPYARGQGRGNTGIYFQIRYEVQVVDSFGRIPGAEDCGAVYSIQPPSVNMTLPPLAWQTMDIYFTEARFDENRQRISPAMLTVYHNGVLVQDHFELPYKTGYGHNEGPEPGPLLLQNHGSPVLFRNVWIEDGATQPPSPSSEGASAASDAE